MMFTTKTGTSWGLPGLVLVQLLVQSLPLPCLCFSRGASGSSCTRMVPGHVHAHPHDPALSPVTLHTPTTYYLPGHLLTVTVRSSRDFMGFLLQARIAERPGLSARIQGENAAVQSGPGAGGLGGILLGGSWTLTPPGTHTVRCFSDEDTVTHSDKQPKRNLSFVWRAPDRSMGDVRFYLTVVQSYFVYWTGISSRVLHDGTRGRWRGNSMRQAQLYDEDFIQDQQEVAQTIKASTMKPDVYKLTATDKRKATPLGIQTQNITMSPNFLRNNSRISGANVKIQGKNHNGTQYDRIGTFVRWEHLFEDKATQTDNQDDESNGLESRAMSSNENKDSQMSERFVKHGDSGHSTIGSFGEEQKPYFGKSMINANKSQQNYTINVVDSHDSTGVNDKIYTTLADQSTHNPFSFTTADSNGEIVASTAKSAKSAQGNTTFSLTLSDVTTTSYLQNQTLVKEQTVKPNAVTITPIKTDPTPITHSAGREKLLETPKSLPAKSIKDLLLHLDSLIVKDNITFKTSKAEETQSVTTTSDIHSSTASQTFSTMNDLENVTLIEPKPTIKSNMNQLFSIASSSEDSKLLRSNSQIDASELYPPSTSPRRFNATKSTLDIPEDATIIRKSLVQNMTDSMSNKTTHSYEVTMEGAVSESATSKNIPVPSLIFESTKRSLTRPATTTSTFFASQSKREFAFTSQNSVSALPTNTSVHLNPKWTNSSIQSLPTTATTQPTRLSQQTISEDYKATFSRWQSQTLHTRSTIASKASAATASVQPRYSTPMPTPNASLLHLILTHFSTDFPSSSSPGQSSTLTKPTYHPVTFPNRQASSVVPEYTTHTFSTDLSSVSYDNIATVSKPPSRIRSVEAATSVPSYIGGAWSKISSTFDEYWKIIANISKSSNMSGEVKGVEDRETSVAPYDTTQTAPLSPDTILFKSKQSNRQTNMLAFSTPSVTPAAALFKTTHSNNFYQQFISSVIDISEASRSPQIIEPTTNLASEMNDNKASLNSWTTSSNTQLEKFSSTFKTTDSNQKNVTFPTSSKDSIHYVITGLPKKQIVSKGSRLTTVGPTTEQNSLDFTVSGITNKDTAGLTAENSSTDQISSHTTVDDTNIRPIFSTVANNRNHKTFSPTNVQRKLATGSLISTDSQISDSKSHLAISTRPFPVHLSKNTTDMYATLPTHNNNVTINQQNQSSIHASYQNVNTTPVLVPKGDIFAHEMERKAKRTQTAAQFNKTMYEGGTSPNEATTVSTILAFYFNTTTKKSSTISPQLNEREDANVYQKLSTHSMTFVTHEATTLYSNSSHSISSTTSVTKSSTALKSTTKISPIYIFLNSSTKMFQSTYSSSSNRPKSHSQTSSNAPTSANLLKSTVPIEKVLTLSINADKRLTKSNTNVLDLPAPSPISSPPNVALITSSQTSPTSLLSTKLDSSPIKLQPSAARQSLVNPVTTFAPSKAQKPLIIVALPNHSVKPNLPISRISQNTNPNEKPKIEVKAKLPPHLHPDRGGKYPDIIPRHSAWELGMLLGCSAGLGMILVVGIKYVHRKACGKRTQVTLHDREREYGRGDRGLIHVQECGDLVRVRRIRENSFVLLAEYDILATPGD